MLLTIAIILLVIWILGLVLHLLGAFIWLFLIAGLIVGITHFVRGKPAA
jgi:hypothetical protein